MEITFITTGGTIDKDYPRATKGYGFEIADPAVVRILQKINPNFEYNLMLMLKKDSLDITEEDRALIFEACSTTGSSKIIITHGSDTMLETAKVLNDIKNKVIILVGAQKPEKFTDSDAAFNVGTAVGAINILKNGVYVAMHGRVFQWDKCERDMKTGYFKEI